MPTYRTPGVYFEWLDLRDPGIVPLRTDIAGFVGIAARGPLHVACKIESWTQFLSRFGGHSAQGFLAYAVEGFFANGGQICYVVRIADPAQARHATVSLVDPAGWPMLEFTAVNEGTWAHALEITAVPTAGNRFMLTLRLGDGTREIWPNLSALDSDPRYAVPILNDSITGSGLLRAAEPVGWSGDRRVVLGGGIGRMRGGDDGLWSLGVEHVTGLGASPETTYGLMALEAIDEIGIVAIPDIMVQPGGRSAPRPGPQPPECDNLERDPAAVLFGSQNRAGGAETGATFAPPFTPDQIELLQRDLVGHCEKLRDRVAILDPQTVDLTPELTIGRRREFDSSFAALYFPWLLVPDPLRLDGLLRRIPPSGHVAGIYARGDLRVGVHKPPANEALDRVQDVAYPLDDLGHAELNEAGVNAIRAYPGRGIRVAGARTLSSDPAWRYVNVRRLLAMIEEAIDEQTQWTVFEPNNPALWRDLARSARGFLDGLWRQGMLDGAMADQAYSVVCDETTNPAQETDLGRLTCLIGVQPPLPAEFVIVRIGKTEQGTQIVESSGAGGRNGRNRRTQRPLPRLPLRDPDQRAVGGWV